MFANIKYAIYEENSKSFAYIIKWKTSPAVGFAKAPTYQSGTASSIEEARSLRDRINELNNQNCCVLKENDLEWINNFRKLFLEMQSRKFKIIKIEMTEIE